MLYPQELGQATPLFFRFPASSMERTATASILHLQGNEDLIIFTEKLSCAPTTQALLADSGWGW